MDLISFSVAKTGQRGGEMVWSTIRVDRASGHIPSRVFHQVLYRFILCLHCHHLIFTSSLPFMSAFASWVFPASPLPLHVCIFIPCFSASPLPFHVCIVITCFPSRPLQFDICFAIMFSIKSFTVCHYLFFSRSFAVSCFVFAIASFHQGLFCFSSNP